MADKILLRRGNKADLPTLDSGEPGFAVDTKELFVGSPDGNQKMVNAAGDTMTGLLNLLGGASLQASAPPLGSVGTIYADGGNGKFFYHDLSNYRELWHSGNCAASLLTNGFQELASGNVLQWGTSVITGSGTIVFPVAFPTLCLHVFGVVESSDATNDVGLGSYTASQCSAWVNGAGAQTVHWLAIGN